MAVAGIVVTVILSLATIAVSLAIARRQMDFIAVDYEVDSDVSLWQADVNDVMASRIQLRYGEQELRHPRIIDVTVTNTGTKPVQESDFDRPIVFKLQGNIHPVDARVIDQHPPDIVEEIFELDADGTRSVAITPRLLNPGDWFKLRMLFNHMAGELEGSHRIVGAAKPMRHYSREQLRAHMRVTTRPIVFTYLLTFAVGAFVMGKITQADIAANPVESPLFSIVAGAILGGVLIATISALVVMLLGAAYMKFFYQ
ncbi:hypothetical protein [Mycolicibacterium sp. S3B2]|uniref:hypothetical protein n=1 Tax=Mycolicibacterium sp. S3B2 TaxID=3415120 RepID=UPI003C799895